MTKEDADNFAKTLPIPRVGKPEEAAALVAFLASEQGGYVTGETVNFNGGAYMN